MKIQQLRAFLEIAETGSINGAAKRLHLTQPAITRTVRELENECGVRLLERTPWGVVVTAEGNALLQRASTALRELERAEEDIAHMKGRREGKLVVGVTPIAGTAGLTNAFVEFRRRWPDVDVEFREISPAQLREQLNQRLLDLAFSAFPITGTESGVEAGALFSFDSVFATRSNGALANAASLADLQDAEWIHTDVTDMYPAYVRELFQTRQLAPPRRITRCTSYSLFYSLALQSDAVIAFTQLTLHASIISRSLVALRIPERPPSLELHLLTPPETQWTKPVQHFVECIRDVAKQRDVGPIKNP
jgi:DNA-binding transcriptional LysR family regulator